MTFRNLLYLTCDDCGEELRSELGETARELRKYAASLGWVGNRRTDYCDECSKKTQNVICKRKGKG